VAQQSTFLEELMAAGRGVIGLLIGDRRSGSYFDLSQRGLAGSFIAFLAVTGLNAVLPVILGMIPHPYYYVGRPFVLASPLEQIAIDYRRLASVDELLATLRGLGVTHAVREADPEKEAVNPIGAHVLELWDGLLARSSEIGAVEAGALYRLPEPTPARASVALDWEHA